MIGRPISGRARLDGQTALGTGAAGEIPFRCSQSNRITVTTLDVNRGMATD